ncbi:MAG: phosphate signaling complex protein PhoU [Candidatus Omnitrophota bacterium]|nr:phosphate signaling complex protein PhoU [Candidatus Omnitrophota bacterium]
MERHFDEELKDLKEKLVRMSSIAEEMIEKSITALKERREDLTAGILEKEKAINMLQIEVDDFALKLIALRQPAASDLRFIISAIKINADLERIGDLAINIVERTKDLLREPPLKPLIDIPRMADITQKMVKDAIDSFINRNPVLAREICKRDDSVDNLNDQIFRELLTYMLQDAKNINRAIDLMLVARHLERIADHATNISEDVYYMVEGRDIRHHAQDCTP